MYFKIFIIYVLFVTFTSVLPLENNKDDIPPPRHNGLLTILGELLNGSHTSANKIN